MSGQQSVIGSARATNPTLPPIITAASEDTTARRLTVMSSDYGLGQALVGSAAKADPDRVWRCLRDWRRTTTATMSAGVFWNAVNSISLV